MKTLIELIQKFAIESERFGFCDGQLAADADSGDSPELVKYLKQAKDSKRRAATALWKAIGVEDHK